MRIEDVRRQSTTPLGAPAYPSGRYRFTDREYLNILSRTDADAMRRIVPEPLEVGDPLVRFEVMRMPDVTGLGAFTESGQVLQVEYQGQWRTTCMRCTSTASPRSPVAARSAPIRRSSA